MTEKDLRKDTLMELRRVYALAKRKKQYIVEEELLKEIKRLELLVLN